MKQLTFDYSSALPFINEHELDHLTEEVSLAHQRLHQKTGAGSDFLGWVDLPADYGRAEYARLKEAAAEIRANSEVLIVIGIGGSYLGARAAVELLGHGFANLLPKEKRRGPQIFFAGHNLSGTYLKELLELIDGKDISINVISKSGTTTEPALAFRVFRAYLEKRCGRVEAAKRIYVTTDRAKGPLKKFADEQGYRSFVIPDNVGGRFSVLTPVGLLPIAAAGIDTDAMLAGAAEARQWYAAPSLEENGAYQYAALRNILYRKGKIVELMVSYEPKLHYFVEWWKQLYGESEGKDHRGVFPAGADFSTDLHSLGQYIQDGLRILFETVLHVEQPQSDLDIPGDAENLDGLNFLSGKSYHFVNEQAYRGTLIAHTDGGVPNLVLSIPALTPEYFGAMVYFFEKACGISGYLLGVNPFDQPGVEAYKQNMFALLGKPGYEKRREDLLCRIAGS